MMACWQPGRQIKMDFSKQFPSSQQLHYLNHAAISPWPQASADAVTRFAEENALQGGLAYDRWVETENRCRQRYARLINANTEDIALLKNTSEGLSFVANGLSWHSGDNIVLPDCEFPSNWLAWDALRSQGVSSRRVAIQSPTHIDNPEQALMDACDERTRLLAVSAIQYRDGFRLDLPVLGQFCRDRDILFSVDAIQQLGMLPLDVQACQVDFLSADAHKWLLGPEGQAVFYVAPEIRQQLQPSQYGWKQYEDPFNFDRDVWQPSASGKRYESGSPNTLGITAADAALGLLLDVGMDQVAERAMRNASLLRGALAESTLINVKTVPLQRQQSAIVNIRPTRGNADQLYRTLLKQGIFCAQRGDGIRLSPHFYQQSERILQAAEMICNAVLDCR
jgi:cysteine desulfurase/selenocysteine lyase